MNYILYNKNKLNDKIVQEKILSFFNLNYKSFIYFLDIKNDTIHYLLFGKKIELIQIIFQKKVWNYKNNISILEEALNRKKYVKNYISYIDKITQYNLLLFDNNYNYEVKDWYFKDSNNYFTSDIYSILLYNLYFIEKKENSKYKELSNFIYNL